MDEQREIEIQKLCEAVLYASLNFYDNPNGGYENTCPFCYEMDWGLNVSISEIEHKTDCAYLIAKSLSTKR